MATILLIEDDVDIRKSIVQALELYDPDNYIIALDGALKPDGIDIRKVDCVLLDLMLAGPQNGVEIARSLRANGFTGRIVALSASQLELENAAADGSFDDFVAKPFAISELLAITMPSVPHKDHGID